MFALLRGSKDFSDNTLKPCTVCGAVPLADFQKIYSSCSCDTSKENKRMNLFAVQMDVNAHGVKLWKRGAQHMIICGQLASC